MAENVLADAQFGKIHVLRPFPSFEAVYDGRAADIPVAFPGTLDASAGQTGFSAYLLAGFEVPLGAKVIIWYPVISYGSPADEGEILVVDYRYLIHWRYRTVIDYLKQRTPYHNTKQSPGVADTMLTPAGGDPTRFLIYSGVEDIIYQQPEVAGSAPGQGNLRTQRIAVPGDGSELLTTFGLPLLPPGAPGQPFPFDGTVPPSTGPVGVFGQGAADPTNAFMPGVYSTYRPYFTVAKGDDMIITVRRSTEEAPNWDFSGVDQGFSNIYGTNIAGPSHAPFERLGILITVGSAPT